MLPGEVSTLDEVHAYLRGVLVPMVVDPMVSARSFDGFVNQQNRMLGAMRLRQEPLATPALATDGPPSPRP